MTTPRTYAFTYRTHHLLRCAIPDTSANTHNAAPPLADGNGHTPQPHACNPCQVSHTHGLASSAIARHYTRNHTLFSSPTGTEMFHFPASTPTQAMHSPAGNRPQRRLGFPIRTSSDQRLVGNSPRHNAASHVLHRPSMPRHPPYALKQNTLQQHPHTPHHHKSSEQDHARAHTKKKEKTLPNQPQPKTGPKD